MKLTLVVLNAGKASGQTIPVKVPQFVIGRDPQCNLRPASAMISKRHCALLVKDGTVLLHDFDSTNGTFLNDQPVKGEVALSNDDVIKVGPLQFKVAIELPQPAVSKPTPPPPPRVARAANSEDEEAAAMLLGIDETTSAATTETSEAEIPGGSTVMDMPAVNPGAPPEVTEGGVKPPEAKKPAEKPKHESAQSAAQALLDKLRKGTRK